MDERILFRDMTSAEKEAMVSIWKTITGLRRISYHTKEKMDRLGITMEMVEETLKNNHIIEYKLSRGREMRMVLRGTRSYPLWYEWKNYDGSRHSLEYDYCNVCIVISAFGDLVTVYNSPERKSRHYSTNYSSSMSDRLRENLFTVLRIAEDIYEKKQKSLR